MLVRVSIFFGFVGSIEHRPNSSYRNSSRKR